MVEMGGLCDETFGGSGRGVEIESKGWGEETGGGDGSETVTEGKGSKNQRSVLMPTSPQT